MFKKFKPVISLNFAKSELHFLEYLSKRTIDRSANKPFNFQLTITAKGTCCQKVPGAKHIKNEEKQYIYCNYQLSTSFTNSSSLGSVVQFANKEFVELLSNVEEDCFRTMIYCLKRFWWDFGSPDDLPIRSHLEFLLGCKQ